MLLSGAEDYVIFEFPSLPENIAFARTAAAVYASRLDFTLDEIDDIKTCVSEAVTNVVVHAYQGKPGLVRVRLCVDDGKLVIVVEDQGRGIPDVEWAKQPFNTTMPDEHTGLGLYFISEFMEELEIDTRVGAGTRIRMATRPSQAEQPRAAASHSH